MFSSFVLSIALRSLLIDVIVNFQLMLPNARAVSVHCWIADLGHALSHGTHRKQLEEFVIQQSVYGRLIDEMLYCLSFKIYYPTGTSPYGDIYGDLQVASPYTEKTKTLGPVIYKASFNPNLRFFTKGLLISGNNDKNDTSGYVIFFGMW